LLSTPQTLEIRILLLFAVFRGVSRARTARFCGATYPLGVILTRSTQIRGQIWKIPKVGLIKIQRAVFAGLNRRFERPASAARAMSGPDLFSM
jgi:hypothetical protein